MRTSNRNTTPRDEDENTRPAQFVHQDDHDDDDEGHDNHNDEVGCECPDDASDEGPDDQSAEDMYDDDAGVDDDVGEESVRKDRATTTATSSSGGVRAVGKFGEEGEGGVGGTERGRGRGYERGNDEDEVENEDGNAMNSANTSLPRQSSVIFICSSGIGTKLLMSMPRERSSGSVCV